MSKVSAQLVKQLRESSGAGIMDCKEALEACNEDTILVRYTSVKVELR